MNTKGLYFTNLAYLCADVANSYAMDAETYLKQDGIAFKHEEKRLFNDMKQCASRLRYLTKRASESLYKIEDVNNGCTLSDHLYEQIQSLLEPIIIKKSTEETKIEITATKRSIKFYKGDDLMETKEFESIFIAEKYGELQGYTEMRIQSTKQ